MTYKEYLQKYSRNMKVIVGITALRAMMQALAARMSEEEFITTLTLFAETMLYKDTEREQLREFLAASHAENKATAHQVAEEQTNGR